MSGNESLPRIFLTGGSGFIGCRLAQQAVARGYRVTVTAAINNSVERQRVDTLLKTGIPVVLASITDSAALTAALRDHEVVIHLAAAQHEAQAPAIHFRRVNVEGTRTLVTLAAHLRVRRFVYGSTIGVYGAAREAVLDESSPLAPDNMYGRTKVEAENIVRSAADRMESCIARISETYGPYDVRLLKLFRAIEHGRYVTLGSGNNTHQVVYVDDLVDALLAAAVEPRAAGETFILAGSERLTTSAMAAAIAAALGRSGTLHHVPLWPFEIAALLMETPMCRLGLQAPLHRRRLDFFRKSFRLSTAKAQELLGFRASTSFSAGARRTADWYRENGLL
jgi:nucleoside-diphosphate-sugar epimerase